MKYTIYVNMSNVNESKKINYYNWEMENKILMDGEIW